MAGFNSHYTNKNFAEYNKIKRLSGSLNPDKMYNVNTFVEVLEPSALS